MGSHEWFGHLQHKLRQKEMSRVKLVVLFLTTKSRESTRLRCVQVEWNTPLKALDESYKFASNLIPIGGLSKKMIPQSGRSPNWDSIGTPPWESRDKKPFGCRCRGEVQRIIYGGRWWLPPSPARCDSCESKVARGLS
jgi:hypothetical protein